MVKATELRNSSKEELKSKHEELKRKLYEMRSELAVTKDVKDKFLFRAYRKDMARILTILTEKEGQ